MFGGHPDQISLPSAIRPRERPSNQANRVAAIAGLPRTHPAVAVGKRVDEPTCWPELVMVVTVVRNAQALILAAILRMSTASNVFRASGTSETVRRRRSLCGNGSHQPAAAGVSGWTATVESSLRSLGLRTSRGFEARHPSIVSTGSATHAKSVAVPCGLSVGLMPPEAFGRSADDFNYDAAGFGDIFPSAVGRESRHAEMFGKAKAEAITERQTA